MTDRLDLTQKPEEVPEAFQETSGEREWSKLSKEELLALYQKDRDPKLKEEITLRYVYLVKAIAIQMQSVFSSAYQMEDIINEGVIAIMKGIDRYDPKRDNQFETYISKRIRGMIIDLVRSSDWMPRNFRKQNKEIEEAQDRLGRLLGRPPTEEELAKELHMEIRKLRRLRRMTVMMNVLSLDMVVEDEDERQTLQLSDTDSRSQPESAYLREETRQILADGIKSLKEKEKLMISLYYVEDLNMKQIAKIMQLSEPRISQIHSSAIRRLKRYMEAHA